MNVSSIAAGKSCSALTRVLRKRILIFDRILSIGFKSGLYGEDTNNGFQPSSGSSPGKSVSFGYAKHKVQRKSLLSRTRYRVESLDNGRIRLAMKTALLTRRLGMTLRGGKPRFDADFNNLVLGRPGIPAPAEKPRAPHSKKTHSACITRNARQERKERGHPSRVLMIHQRF